MPNGEIPHLIEGPRSRRCNQHREEYEKWKGRNYTRKTRGKPAVPWAPSPLTAANRKRAAEELEKFPQLLASTFTPDLAKVAAAQQALAQELAAVLQLGGLTGVQEERIKQAFGSAKGLRDRMSEVLMDMGMSPAAVSKAMKPRPPGRP